MTKSEFLFNLEQEIIDGSRNTPLGLLRLATRQNIHQNDVYKTILFITNDEDLTNEMTQLCEIFRYRNKLFDKHVMDIIYNTKNKKQQ